MFNSNAAQTDDTLQGRPFPPEVDTVEWNVAGNTEFGTGSITQNPIVFEFAREGANGPGLVVVYNEPRPSGRSFYCFVHNVIDPLDASSASGAWDLLANSSASDEEKMQHSFELLKKTLRDVLRKYDRERETVNLQQSSLYSNIFDSNILIEVQSELDLFSEGVRGIKPDLSVVQLATRLAVVAAASCEFPDISMDIDGELSFDLRLKDGRLVLAELAVDGSIDASVYDRDNSLLMRMPVATENEFTAILKN